MKKVILFLLIMGLTNFSAANGDFFKGLPEKAIIAQILSYTNIKDIINFARTDKENSNFIYDKFIPFYGLQYLKSDRAKEVDLTDKDQVTVLNLFTQQIKEKKPFIKLKVLKVGDNIRGVLLFAQPHASNLISLNLANTDGYKIVGYLLNLENLEYLNLSNVGFGDKLFALESLNSTLSISLPKLKILDITNNNIPAAEKARTEEKCVQKKIECKL